MDFFSGVIAIFLFSVRLHQKGFGIVEACFGNTVLVALFQI
jgi:hypothetical protein